jgi:hypothetical protein
MTLDTNVYLKIVSNGLPLGLPLAQSWLISALENGFAFRIRLKYEEAILRILPAMATVFPIIPASGLGSAAYG